MGQFLFTRLNEYRRKQILILGIIDSKPSAAAIVKDGVPLAAIAEERLCRMKLASGVPRGAISQVMADAGIIPDEIDLVAVAQKVCVYEAEPIPWQGWFDGIDRQKTFQFDRLSGKLAPIFGRLPLAWKIHHILKQRRSQERLRALPALLRNQYGIVARVHFYDHHNCHAAAAFFGSGFDEALTVTLDGGGDGRSGSVYLGENGQLKQLASVDSFNSLGNFYSYITELCGFKAEKHEGKITGLAALGEPKYAGILREMIRYQPPGNIRYSVPMYHHSALRLIRERLPANFNIADLAASAQLVLEEIGSAFVQYWAEQSGVNKVAVAGGVFANVKLNQRVFELANMEQLFIYPAMDDSGLAVGGALAAEAELSQPLPAGFGKLQSLYLGSGFTDEEIQKAIASAGLQANYDSHIPQTIAQLLANGHVVARFSGRMEFGPRALGHRSILYRANDPTVNDWLNKRLNRTEFMPFAPATLESHAMDCFKNIKGAEIAAQFMTITFDCSEAMAEQSPAVVHVDGTARPQIVSAKIAPDLHKILSAYYELTGIPTLINTSFNLHGEPIVCTPKDAIRSFQMGNLDYLAIGNWLIPNPTLTASQLVVKRKYDERITTPPSE